MNIRGGFIGGMLALAAACMIALAPLPSLAQDGPPQEVFPPPGEKGPVVIVISGASGPLNYKLRASQVSKLGYYTVLIDGKDILTRTQDGAANLRAVIAKAQAAPQGMPGKVMAIGFSQGGGGVLAHAVAMPELVHAAVAYYPSVAWARANLPALGARVQVPLLILTGERDRYQNCCTIEAIREVEAGAKGKDRPVQLVVYPDADHSFDDYGGRTYRAADTEDAWRRTREMLAKHHPVK